MKRLLLEDFPSARRQKVKEEYSSNLRGSRSGLTKEALRAYWSNKKFGAAQPWSTWGAQRVRS